MNDTLRIAVIAVLAVIVAKAVLPHVPNVGPTIAAKL